MHADIVIVFISFYFVPFRSVLPSLSPSPHPRFCSLHHFRSIVFCCFLSFMNLTFTAASIYTLTDPQQTRAQPHWDPPLKIHSHTHTHTHIMKCILIHHICIKSIGNNCKDLYRTQLLLSLSVLHYFTLRGTHTERLAANIFSLTHIHDSFLGPESCLFNPSFSFLSGGHHSFLGHGESLH